MMNDAALDLDRPPHTVPLLAVLITLDPLLTWFAIEAGAAEAHPLWRASTGWIGTTGGLLVRGGAGLAAVMVLMLMVEAGIIRWRVFRPLCIAFGLVCVWNAAVWLTA